MVPSSSLIPMQRKTSLAWRQGFSSAFSLSATSSLQLSIKWSPRGSHLSCGSCRPCSRLVTSTIATSGTVSAIYDKVPSTRCPLFAETRSFSQSAGDTILFIPNWTSVFHCYTCTADWFPAPSPSTTTPSFASSSNRRRSSSSFKRPILSCAIRKQPSRAPNVVPSSTVRANSGAGKRSVKGKRSSTLPGTEDRVRMLGHTEDGYHAAED